MVWRQKHSNYGTFVMKIRINDVRATGHCVQGIQYWFASMGLDFREFMRDGIDSEVILATEDALARRVVSQIQKMKAETNG